MRAIFFVVLAMAPSLSFASQATDVLGISDKFPGTYQRVQAKGDGAETGCPEQLTVVAIEYGVRVESNGRFIEAFNVGDKGCTLEEGDIGPDRTRCTKFREKSVSYTDTSVVTIVGFVRTYSGIRLGAFDSDLLTYQHDNTQIPFGFTNLWDKDKFNCQYKRVSN